MKASLFTSLVAVPLLSLSSMAFAAEPVQLTAAQMDSVTAGQTVRDVRQSAAIFQINVSPVTVTQVSLLNFGVGSGDVGNNTAFITSGNFAAITQRSTITQRR